LAALRAFLVSLLHRQGVREKKAATSSCKLWRKVVAWF
jgi:hypothetical protein